jgi:hypothetical protein
MSVAMREGLGERAEARTAGHAALPTTQSVTASCRPSAKSRSDPSDAERLLMARMRSAGMSAITTAFAG